MLICVWGGDALALRTTRAKVRRSNSQAMTGFPQGRPGRAKCADRFSEPLESLDGKASDDFLPWPVHGPGRLDGERSSSGRFQKAYLKRPISSGLR